jgi:hypothetical protein
VLAVEGIFGDVIDDDGTPAIADFIADRGLDREPPPALRPKSISSRTAQAIQRSSVTRAIAAKPMPVVRHTTSRMVGTASIRPTARRRRRGQVRLRTFSSV